LKIPAQYNNTIEKLCLPFLVDAIKYKSNIRDEHLSTKAHDEYNKRIDGLGFSCRYILYEDRSKCKLCNTEFESTIDVVNRNPRRKEATKIECTIDIQERLRTKPTKKRSHTIE
jgi:hypothetical protein